MTSSRVLRLAAVGLALSAFTATPARAEMILTANSQVIFVNDATTPGTQGTTFSLPGNTTGVAINQSGVGFGNPVANQGDFYVATDANTLRLFSKDASNQLASTSSGLNSPLGIALDPAGNVYAANTGTNQVLRYPITGGSTPTVFFSATSPRFLAFAAPEPGSLTLVALGSAAGLLGYWRRRKANAPTGEAPAAPEEAPAV